MSVLVILGYALSVLVATRIIYVQAVNTDLANGVKPSKVRKERGANLRWSFVEALFWPVVGAYLVLSREPATLRDAAVVAWAEDEVKKPLECSGIVPHDCLVHNRDEMEWAAKVKRQKRNLRLPDGRPQYMYSSGICYECGRDDLHTHDTFGLNPGHYAIGHQTGRLLQ